MSAVRENFDGLAENARAMRAEGATYKQIKEALGIGSYSTISRMLGVTGTGRRRRRITDEQRARARELRREGKSVPEISRELGIARSTAWQITKDIAWTPAHDVGGRQVSAARRRWRAYEKRREVERKKARKATYYMVGELSDRELLLAGAVLYWAEGTKSKPWCRREQLQFINSDPDVIRLFLAWLDLLGVAPERLAFHVSIHAAADVVAAERFWAGVVGVSPERFQQTTVKRHNAKTVRKNTGGAYHGCLVVRVRKSAVEYWRMEDLWTAMVRSVDRAVAKREAA